jgi:hypothetical protein
VSAPNSMGGLSLSATPAQFGPRNCGHEGTAPALATHNTISHKGFMAFTYHQRGIVASAFHSHSGYDFASICR